jgi:hypothetical protein
VKEVLDVRKHTRENPWAMVGGATAAGLVTGLLVFRRESSGAPRAAVAPTPFTSQPAAPAVSHRPAWLNDLFEMVQTDPEKLWFLDKTVRFTIGTDDIGDNGAVVDVPDDYEHAYSIFMVDADGNLYKPIGIPDEADAKKRFGPADSGEPSDISCDGESFRLWPPSPEQDYEFELNYKSQLTQVSATDDTNKFMLNYHAVIVEGLRAKAWEYLGQEERAEGYWMKWEKRWADMRAANVARILAGELTFSPRTDVKGNSSDQRGGERPNWGS